MFNSGTALRIVCELALERMAELIAKEEQDGENKESGAQKVVKNQVVMTCSCGIGKRCHGDT